MESKRKTRRVRKAGSETPEPQKQDPQQPKSAEALIKYNGDLIEGLFKSSSWTEIAFPLLREMIAGVSGRFTNGRFYKGRFTKDTDVPLWLSGYQCALEEFHNGLHDFIRERDNLKKKKAEEDAESKAPVFNPFLEEKED